MRPQSEKLLFGKLKHEICREAFQIAPDLFVEALGRHTVERGQIGIDDDLLPAQQHDGLRDVLGGHECVLIVRRHGQPREALRCALAVFFLAAGSRTSRLS